MNQIRNYIDAMFSTLPKTREVVEIKLTMLENMEEKFQELLKKGKSEDEAVGIVLEDFGSMKELQEELGISDKSDENINFENTDSNTYTSDACKQKNIKTNSRIANLTEVTIFPITVIIYLCMGFFANLWHPGWVIFIIAAVIRNIINI